MDKVKSYAAPMLVVGCVLFGLGSLIVKFVPVGGYAIAFWRLLIASFIFWFLMKLKRQRFPKSRKAMMYAALAGIFLAFDLSFWHESVYAVGHRENCVLVFLFNKSDSLFGCRWKFV